MNQKRKTLSRCVCNVVKPSTAAERCAEGANAGTDHVRTCPVIQAMLNTLVITSASGDSDDAKEDNQVNIHPLLSSSHPT